MVAVRISCFEDEILAKFRGDLSIQAKWGKPYKIGWLDPANPGGQDYIIELAKEAMDAGADEIQLDYVRYPVLGIKGADFKLEERKTTKVEVIRNFVRRVHEVTKPRGVALSLDIFGVVAEGKRIDIDMLGQDPAMLAPECEALADGVPVALLRRLSRLQNPGNHPEIVGYGTKGVIEQIRAGGVTGGAVIRPWLQGMSYKAGQLQPQVRGRPDEELRTERLARLAHLESGAGVRSHLVCAPAARRGETRAQREAEAPVVGVGKGSPLPVSRCLRGAVGRQKSRQGRLARGLLLPRPCRTTSRRLPSRLRRTR
ncbi:MAG: hypothetical protein IPG50_20645 [Myxococcales bacterium]|nr:hypothetical protein [Myxococcales bacterium]